MSARDRAAPAARSIRLRDDEHDLERVTTPIGVPEVAGKAPATIAVSVAARILQLIEEAQAAEVEATR